VREKATRAQADAGGHGLLQTGGGEGGKGGRLVGGVCGGGAVFVGAPPEPVRSDSGGGGAREGAFGRSERGEAAHRAARPRAMAPRRWAGAAAWLGAAALAACLARGAGAVPSGWKCDVTYYGDKNTCDCACGVWDPDCDLRGQLTNHSTHVGLTTTEKTPACKPPVIDAYNPDPAITDCWCVKTATGGGKLATGFPTPPPVAPTGFPSLKPTGKPTRQPTIRPSKAPTTKPSRTPTGAPTPDPLAPPTSWQCERSRWLDGVCDCGCNDRDPHCDVFFPKGKHVVCETFASTDASDLYNQAGTNSSRLDNLYCVAEKDQCDLKRPPPQWSCDPTWFRNNICDCNCGAPDPDCSPEKRSFMGIGNTPAQLACNQDQDPNGPVCVLKTADDGDNGNAGNADSDCWCRPDNFKCDVFAAGTVPGPYAPGSPTTSSPVAGPTSTKAPVAPTPPTLKPSPGPPTATADNAPTPTSVPAPSSSAAAIGIGVGVGVAVLIGAVAAFVVVKKSKPARLPNMAAEEMPTLGSASSPLDRSPATATDRSPVERGQVSII
jgi:hypothetical protein